MSLKCVDYLIEIYSIFHIPAPGDHRLVRLRIRSQATDVTETLSPDLTIAPVPQASVADSLQGLTPENLLQLTGNSSPYSVSKSALDVLLGNVTGGTTSSAADASGLHNHDSLYAKTITATGTANFTVPAHNWIDIELWGGRLFPYIA